MAHKETMTRLDWAQWMARKGVNVFICTPQFEAATGGAVLVPAPVE